MLHAIDTCLEKCSQSGGIKGFFVSDRLAAIAEEGAKDGTGSSTHAAHHLRPYNDEAFAAALSISGQQTFLCRRHSTLHAQPMIAVTEVSVRLGELRLGSNDALTGKNEHGFNFVFGEIGFWHSGPDCGAECAEVKSNVMQAIERAHRSRNEQGPPRSLAAGARLRHGGTMLFIPIILIILCVGLCRWASGRYESMLAQASEERAPTAHNGAEVARLFFAYEGVEDVEIVEHNGMVTNYFDPARRRLFLSPSVAAGTTMAAWTLALHEAAHALQTDEALGDLKWRQTVIKMARYGPVFAAVAAALMMFFMKFPPRFAFIALLAVCIIFLLLNVGTLAVEFNANERLRRFLEKHLVHRPSAHEHLLSYLQKAATRELGDLLSSPRYFLFSAMPGSGSTRPAKRAEEQDSSK